MGIFSELRHIRRENGIEQNDIFYDVSNVQQTSLPSVSSPPAYNVDTTTVILAVAGAAAFGLAVIIVVAILIYRKRRKNKRSRISAKYDHMATSLFRTQPFTVVGTKRQLSEPTPRTSYSSFEGTNDIKVSDLELSQYKESKARQSKGNLTKFATFESSGSTSPPPAPKGLKRSKSLVMRYSFDEAEHTVSVSFTLKYVHKLRQLHLKLLRIADIPIKNYGNDIYVSVYLFPRNTDGVHSRSVRADKDVVLNEAFLFDDMTLPEVEKSTLRLVLSYKKKNLSGKDGVIGEMFMECGDVDLSSEQAFPFNFNLDKNKVRSGTRDKYLLEELGSLFVCLEYQQTANRMKVMVRKASGLPKSDKLIGRPAHYVTIKLLKNKEVLREQETKSQSGYFPIWNQPFLFDLSGHDVSECSFDFVIMRGKLHTKDTIVGHVTVGNTGCRSGRQHWNEILSPRPTENAKWHAISPVLGTKVG